MSGISINILSNVREAVQGAEKVADVVDEVSDALHDLTKEGDTATDRMADDFRDFSRKAEAEAKSVKDAMRQAFKDGRAAVKDATDDATKDVKKFSDTAKDEFKDSAREGAQSFTGEFSDVQDVLQETVANLGPAGIVGAAVIGALVSTATASVEAWNEKIQGIKDSTAEMWQQAASDGQQFVDGESIRAEAVRILWDKTYEADFKTAERYGIKRSDLATAIAAGEGETFDRVHQQFMDAKDDEIEKMQDSMRENGLASGEFDRTAQSNIVWIDKTIAALDEKSKAVEDNKRKNREAQDVSNNLHQEERDQIQRTADAERKRYEGLAGLYAQPINATVRLTVDDTAWRNYKPVVKTAQISVSGQPVYRQGGRYLE